MKWISVAALLCVCLLAGGCIDKDVPFGLAMKESAQVIYPYINKMTVEGSELNISGMAKVGEEALPVFDYQIEKLSKMPVSDKYVKMKADYIGGLQNVRSAYSIFASLRNDTNTSVTHLNDGRIEQAKTLLGSGLRNISSAIKQLGG